MKKLAMTAGLILVVSLSATAQNHPSAEVSGGFSYFHAERGGNLYGWDASAAGNLNNWLGIVGEFSGHYSTNNSSFLLSPGPFPGIPTPIDLRTSADTNIYTFLFGPRLSYRKNKRLTPYFHVLPGFARSHVSATETSVTLDLDVHISDSTTGFAMAVGGGLDLTLTRSLAFRVLQADYLVTHLGSATQSNVRLTTGLVYRFGK